MTVNTLPYTQVSCLVCPCLLLLASMVTEGNVKEVLVQLGANKTGRDASYYTSLWIRDLESKGFNGEGRGYRCWL